ncbi:MAG: histone deacetylase [Bacteroidetes bacterium HGW-Bacteroidetes-3]|nr:MAG: histone deacetylase [Bacteroidetes bacterium HGW-Bacteroidetes-3]
MASRTGIVKDICYLRHETSAFHPESPKRLQAIYEMLDDAEMKGKFVDIKPRCATSEEIGRIHNAKYIASVEKTAGLPHCYLDPDTETSPESCSAAKMAAGGFCSAIDSVLKGEVRNAFAFVRPPGHHAESDRAAGFCLFNNVAIGAMHALQSHQLNKILIVDWDLHHGNGTQHSFYEDNRVVYFSTHQFPFYPGTGSIYEIGRGKGLGYTINVPLAQGPGDAEFMRIYQKLLTPVALEFKPQLILISAGFDIYFEDPLGGMRVTPKGFAGLVRVLMNVADKCCDGKLAVILEGGYHVQGLTESVRAVLREMRNDTNKSEQDLYNISASANPAVDRIIQTVVEQVKPFWKSLQ